MFRQDALARGRYRRVPLRWEIELGRWASGCYWSRVAVPATGPHECGRPTTEGSARVCKRVVQVGREAFLTRMEGGVGTSGAMRSGAGGPGFRDVGDL